MASGVAWWLPIRSQIVKIAIMARRILTRGILAPNPSNGDNLRLAVLGPSTKSSVPFSKDVVLEVDLGGEFGQFHIPIDRVRKLLEEAGK